MHGFIPQPSTCPRCGIPRTVRVGFSGISFCMNCRTQWGSSSSTSQPPNIPGAEGESAYSFTSTELARLEIYRRAVAAGFYAG
jgi:hypothetical protein